MVLPLATTTITVLRAPPEDAYAEPYAADPRAGLQEVVTGVRAVIDIPVARDAGHDVVAGGEQTVTDFRFSCDPCELRNSDYLHDEATAITYRITWCFEFHGSHIEGGLRLVEGLV